MLLEELNEKMEVRWLLLWCSDLGVASSVLAWRHHGHGQALPNGRVPAMVPFLLLFLLPCLLPFLLPFLLLFLRRGLLCLSAAPLTVQSAKLYSN